MRGASLERSAIRGPRSARAGGKRRRRGWTGALRIGLFGLGLLSLGLGGRALAEGDRAAPGGAAPSSGAPASIVGADGARMVLVPGGPFIMGDDRGLANERPRRRVEVGAFYLDETEVTNAGYRRVFDWVQEHTDQAVRHPDQPAGKDHTPRYWKAFRPALLARTGVAKLQRFTNATFRQDDRPVVGVDWFDAYAYARWAKKRLPTEAEWERGARGTDGRTWPWGDRWDFGRANSGGYEWAGERDGFCYAAPVRSFPGGVSPAGCYEMAGNVWEWVESGYAPRAGEACGDRTASPGRLRVIKGGGSSSYPSSVRPAARRGYEPGYRAFNIGFRCAQDGPAVREER